MIMRSHYEGHLLPTRSKLDVIPGQANHGQRTVPEMKEIARGQPASWVGVPATRIRFLSVAESGGW